MKYTLSNDDNNFLVVNDIGNKKDILLDYFEKFLGDDCPPVSPAEDISHSIFKDIIKPIEQNEPFILDITLFYKFGKWATYQANFHSCRGRAANKILREILGFSFSRKDISSHSFSDYYQLPTSEIYSNLLIYLNKNRDLIVLNK